MTREQTLKLTHFSPPNDREASPLAAVTLNRRFSRPAAASSRSPCYVPSRSLASRWRGSYSPARGRPAGMIRHGLAAITRYATSCMQARSIPLEDRFPRAYAYINDPTTIRGSYASRDLPSSR